MEKKRPGGLLAIAIIGIILGSLGGCMGLWGMGSVALQGPLQESQRRMLERSGDNPQIQAQLAAQDEIYEVTRRWMPFTLTHQGLNLIASMVLLAASVLLLRWSGVAPAVFLGAVVANVVVDAAGSILGILVQQDTSEVMQRMMAATASGTPGAPPEMERMFEGIMQASSFVGVCFGVGWLLVKLGFYVWGVVYLRRPATRGLFVLRGRT